MVVGPGQGTPRALVRDLPAVSCCRGSAARKLRHMNLGVGAENREWDAIDVRALST